MVTTLIPELITVIGVVVIMLIKDWRLAPLSTIPLMIGGIWFVQTASYKRWQFLKSSAFNAYVHEDIRNECGAEGFWCRGETRDFEI